MKKTTKIAANTNDHFSIVLATFNQEEKTRAEIKTQRETLVAFGRIAGYTSEGLVNYLAALVPAWPVNTEGARIAFGSVTPMHHGEFRATIEFRALNAFKSWLYYSYDANLAEKAKKTTSAAPKPDELRKELAGYTVDVLQKKAKSRGLVLPEKIRKPELVAVLTEKIIADGPKSTTPQDKLVNTFKTLRQRVDSKRTFKAETMAQLKAKLTEIIQLLEQAEKETPTDHGK